MHTPDGMQAALLGVAAGWNDDFAALRLKLLPGMTAVVSATRKQLDDDEARPRSAILRGLSFSRSLDMRLPSQWVERVISRRAVVLALIALGAGCASAEPPDTRAQDEAAIRAAEVAWSATINKKDVDQFVSYYAPDAVVMPPNEPVATSPDAIKKAIAGFMATPGLTMTFQSTSVSVAKSGDLAYSVGTYDASATGPDGKPAQDKGKYATVWKKQADGSWKAVADIFNTDMPMAPPPPPRKGK